MNGLVSPQLPTAPWAVAPKQWVCFGFGHRVHTVAREVVGQSPTAQSLYPPPSEQSWELFRNTTGYCGPNFHREMSPQK